MKQLRASAGVERSAKVTFTFDGAPVTAHAGETVAAALLTIGVRVLRTSARDGAPRGAFCLMGLCQECVVEIDGRVTESCRTLVSEGLRVVSRRASAAS